MVTRIKNTLKSAKIEEFCTNRKNEAINILPRNAQNPQETAKNAGISAEATNKREVNTTQPVESGRSMVEMLGVLAVIGVLSVAGIAGYQFAMTKYRANQIANEVNLASAQISFALMKPHKESFDLTLGSPYDDGILSSGFTFTYGCGTDTEMIGCFADDVSYYETLSGLPEDLCKTVAQLTQNLPNLVEQKVNDTVDTMGTSCNEDNNEIVMLFAIDEYNPDDSTTDEFPYLGTMGSQCSSDDDCGTWFCKNGQCIECLTDGDCSDTPNNPICNNGMCMSCKSHNECQNIDPTKPYCGVKDLGRRLRCVECLQDSHCKSGEYCAMGTCSPSRECASSTECTNSQSGVVCLNGQCQMIRCDKDSDCPSGHYCLYNYCNISECDWDVQCKEKGKTKCVLYDYQTWVRGCQ